MTLLRTGTVLHMADNSGAAICGWPNAEPPGKVTDDDLLCGKCRQILEQRDNVKIPFGSRAEPAVTDSLTEYIEGRLAALPYDQYLQTRHWTQFREIALDHYNFKCVVCGSRKDVQVHHRSYARRGRETLADVTVLCAPCHAHHHRVAS